MAKQVIKFYANWCGPCKMYGPTFDRVKQDLQDIIEFTEVNVENDEENLSGEYKVKGTFADGLIQIGCDCGVWSYPCPTIQAITEELK